MAAPLTTRRPGSLLPVARAGWGCSSRRRAGWTASPDGQSRTRTLLLVAATSRQGSLLPVARAGWECSSRRRTGWAASPGGQSRTRTLLLVAAVSSSGPLLPTTTVSMSRLLWRGWRGGSAPSMVGGVDQANKEEIEQLCYRSSRQGGDRATRIRAKG